MKNYRIYYSPTITVNDTITLPNRDSHHLITVLRLKQNNIVNLFNKDGEWRGQIVTANKNYTKVLITNQIRLKENVKKEIHLLYAPLKNTATGFLITKATELGVTEITQVITAQTTNNPLNPSKITLKAKEAAEQCGRLSLPKVNTTINLSNLLKNLNQPLLWLNEQQKGCSLIKAINNTTENNQINLLIGPEGGFSTEEFAVLSNNNLVTPVYLKGNILKAETAAIVATALAVYL